MPSLVELVQRAVEDGSLEAWKAALLREWIASAPAQSAGPTTEALADLLLDPAVLARLKTEVDGPWDVLAAQARSLKSHESVGGALRDLISE